MLSKIQQVIKIMFEKRLVYKLKFNLLAHVRGVYGKKDAAYVTRRGDANSIEKRVDYE